MLLADKEFEKIVSEALDSIPDKYLEHIDNVAFVVEDEPNPQQRRKLNLACNETLFGLYEGIPLTRRGTGYNLVLPDKITIFKKPIEAVVNSPQEAEAIVRHTVWHEVAHYYGLDHDRIHALESRTRLLR